MSVPVKQAVHINFSGGLDLKNDPWQIDASNFLALNNSVFTTGGRLTKRNGFAALSKTINSYFLPLTNSNLAGSLTSANKVFAYQNELLLNDSFNLYSYDKANSGWNYKGRSTMVSPSTLNIAQDTVTKTDMDCSIDTTSGIKVFAWYEADNTAVKYSIQDTVTGQFIVNKSSLGANYFNPRCLSISGTSYIFAINGGDNNLYYQKIVGQTVTGSPTSLLADINASEPYYDVDYISGNIYIATFTSTPTVRIAQYSSSLSIVNSIAKSESASNGLSIFGDGTNIWVVYGNNTNVKAFIVNNAVTSTTAAPTNISAKAATLNVTGTWSSTLSKAFIFYDAGTTTFFNTATLSGSTITPGTQAAAMKSVNIVSKAFAVSGIPHIMTVFESNLQATYFLLNIYNLTGNLGLSFSPPIANIAAKISPDAAGSANDAGHLSGIHNTSGSLWEMALGQKTFIGGTTSAIAQIGVTPSTIFYSSKGVIDCQLDFSLSNPDVQVLGNNAHIATGELVMYDGANVVEQNFHIFPEGATAVLSNGGGGTHLGNASATTLYSYIFTYEWFDNQGQLHRSSPSPVFTPLDSGHTYTFASGVTDGVVTLTIPTLRVTNKDGVVIKVYRTTGNGSIYYLVNSAFNATANDPSADTISYTDNSADSAIIANIQIYTTGEQEDFAPPAATSLSTFKNRMLLVPAAGGYNFFYSKQVLSGSPVEFVPEFDQNIGTVAGPLIAVAGMDDKIILFKSGTVAGPSILYMVGTGPAASGANNDFTDPLPVAVDVGCSDRQSIVLTPAGLIFKTDKGIYLLDRNLQASYIGAPVEAYNQYSVLSSQLIPNTTQVRFLLSNGTLLMFDYFYGKWSTFSNPAGISDCIFQGQHTYVSSTGQVYQETPGVYVDGTNTAIALSFTTAWIKLAGLQGYQRAYAFYLLAEYLSAHQLSLSIFYDFSAASAQTTTITPSTTDTLENWRVFLAKQRCQSIQIALTETPLDTSNAGFTMSGINLIAGVKGPFRTISSAQSAG